MRATAEGPLLTSVTHEVDGLHLRVRCGGAAPDEATPTVVLVHGVGLASDYMMPTARQLARHCRVYVPDLPGFGKSDKPPGTLDAGASAEVLQRWMASIGLHHATFLGNSFGCNIAVELAIRHPARVESLVLQGATIDPAGRSWTRAFLRSLRDPQLVRLIPIGIYQYPRAGLRRIYQTYQAVLDHPIEARLPLIRAPTLVVHGANDPITPVRWGEEMVRLLPHGTLRIIPGTTHVATFLAPLELTRISLPFIRRHHRRSIQQTTV